MPSVDELLDLAAAEPLTNDLFVINQDTREISVPGSELIFGVEEDKNTERKYFRCPKVVGDNVDLTALRCKINYVNANGEYGQYLVEDVAADGDYINFTWLISENVCAYKGTITFLVMFEKALDANTFEKVWHTTVATGEVIVGIKGTGENIAERHPDIIEQILLKLENGGGSGGGMTAAERQQLNKNTEDISELSEELANHGERITRLENGSSSGGSDTPSQPIVVDSVSEKIIYDLPTNLVEQPIFSEKFRGYVNPNDDLNRVIVKPAVCMYANHYGFVFTENIVGTTADLPNVNGVTNVKGRYFWQYSETNRPTDVTKVIAEKGMAYTKFDGTNGTIGGGVGYSSMLQSPTNYVALAYFSFDDGKDGGDIVIGGATYHLHPCVATFNYNNGEVGEIRELTLTINGEKGKFDLTRFGKGTVRSYYTTVAPFRNNNLYHWIQPCGKSLVYLTSSDGIEWTYKYSIDVPFTPYYETPICVLGTTRAIISCRTNYDVKRLYVLQIDLTNGNIVEMSYINDVGSRPSFLVWGGNAYLLHSTSTRKEMEMLHVSINQYGFDLYRWFKLDGKMSYYPIAFVHNSTSKTIGFTLCGLNGEHTTKKGMEWVDVSLSNYEGARTIDQCVGKSPISPIRKTEAMTNEVGVDEYGKLWVASNGSNAESGLINSWTKVADSNIVADSTSHRITLDESYDHYLIFGNIKASANALLNVSANGTYGYSTNRIASMTNGINTNANKKFRIEIEKIDSKIWKVEWGANLEGVTSQVLNSVGIGSAITSVEDIEYFEFVSGTSGQAFTNGNIKVYAK